MPIYEVEHNGKTYEVDAPDPQSAAGAFAPAATEKPEQRLAGVGIQTVSDADWDKLTPLERMQGLLKAGGYGLTSMLGMGDAGHQAVDHPGATLASGAVPGVLSAAGKYGAPAIRAAAETTAKVLEHPAVGGTVGAVEGYRRGGLEGALFGSAAGMAGSSYTARYLRRMMPSAATAAAVDPASARMVEGMSAAGRQAATPSTRPAVTPPPIPTPQVKRVVVPEGQPIDPVAAVRQQAAQAAPTSVDALREQLVARDPAASRRMIEGMSAAGKDAAARPAPIIEPAATAVAPRVHMATPEAAIEPRQAHTGRVQQPIEESRPAAPRPRHKAGHHPASESASESVATAAAAPQTPAAPARTAAPAARSGVDALREQLMLRDPDWRTVDAVPIDAIKRDVVNGGSIIEAGESRVGLGDRLAKAVKDGDAAEIDRLAKAMRQRMHITAKSGR